MQESKKNCAPLFFTSNDRILLIASKFCFDIDVQFPDMKSGMFLLPHIILRLQENGNKFYFF